MAYGFDSDKNKVEVIEKVVLTAQATVAANMSELIYFNTATLANYGITSDEYEQWFIIGMEQKAGSQNYTPAIIANDTIYPAVVTFDDIGGLCISVFNKANATQTIKLRVALMKVEA